MELNQCEQVYLWSSRDCMVYPVEIVRAWQRAGKDVSHFDTPLVFPERSYVQSVEGRIYEPDDTTNNFVSFQRCVAECGYQFNNKSPFEIRAHFASCEKRNKMPVDPLGDLCALQLGAERNETLALHEESFCETLWSLID
ncbi:hypothetical protein BT69DRAFT_444312 [Atractiella rhizophila]|nr:hypothetical protein BT69DRAFT_444312 [Atractiella rhizophila]